MRLRHESMFKDLGISIENILALEESGLTEEEEYILIAYLSFDNVRAAGDSMGLPKSTFQRKLSIIIEKSGTKVPKVEEVIEEERNVKVKLRDMRVSDGKQSSYQQGKRDWIWVSRAQAESKSTQMKSRIKLKKHLETLDPESETAQNIKEFLAGKF